MGRAKRKAGNEMQNAVRVEIGMRSKPKRRGKPKLVVVHGDRQLGTDEGQTLLLGATERYHARRLQRRLERTKERLAHSPERQSVAIAMLAVEEQIVKALWTIARQPLGKIAPLQPGRCGLEYLHDRADIHAIYADAAGGKWDSIAPRPSVPSAKDITAADRVQEWLLLIDDEGLRKLLVVGATSKRGDAGRRVPWDRLRAGLPDHSRATIRTIQRAYDEALRILVDKLTLARMSPVSHKGG